MTTETGKPASSTACRMVPLPDARTPSLTQRNYPLAPRWRATQSRLSEPRHHFGHQDPGLGGVQRDFHAGCREGVDLGLGGPLGAGDDRAGMAHLLARRSRHAGDVRHDRLGHLLGDEVRCLLLLGAADLADQADRPRLRIGLERRQAIDEVGSWYRIAADTDARGHPDALLLQLVEGLVGERARPADDADRSTG